MKLDTRTILLGISALVVLGGVYWYFFTGTTSGNNPALTTSIPSGNSAQTQFETLAGELKPVSFNLGIFSDPRFTALVDIGTPITPESNGRIDPFASLNGK